MPGAPCGAAWVPPGRPPMLKFALGQSVTRLEDDRLLKGAGCYTDDFDLPDALHACLVRSPHAHARILKIDFSEAVKSSRVKAIFTARDVEAAVLPHVHCLLPV